MEDVDRSRFAWLMSEQQEQLREKYAALYASVIPEHVRLTDGRKLEVLHEHLGGESFPVGEWEKISKEKLWIIDHAKSIWNLYSRTMLIGDAVLRCKYDRAVRLMAEINGDFIRDLDDLMEVKRGRIQAGVRGKRNRRSEALKMNDARKMRFLYEEKKERNPNRSDRDLHTDVGRELGFSRSTVRTHLIWLKEQEDQISD